MKSTGIVRKVDRLGRVVLPMSIRTRLGIQEDDPVEIYVDGEQIILQKYQPACVFCGKEQDVVEWKDKRLCKACVSQIKVQL